MSIKSEKIAERDNAIANLRKFLKPGDNVSTTVLHVARSGMSRSIRCQAVRRDDDGNPYISDISYLVARAIGARLDDRGGVVIGGCGFDATFEVVYSLGRTLFPNGFAPSNKARRPLDGKIVSVDVGRGMKRSAAVPFALDREWIEKKRAAGFKFTRGRNGDESGWDNDGGYALNRMR